METLKELTDTVRFDYLNERAAIARLACAFLNKTAHEDISFAASCELLAFGPANDWNGERSAAMRVYQEWDQRILIPALALYRKILANRQATETPKENSRNVPNPTPGKVAFDYENQAWLSDGKYVRCGHPEHMDCGCYGRLHEGESAAANANIH